MCLLLRHTSAFPEKRLVQVRGLEPRIDSPSWSFTAWVQLEKGKGKNILRKPLGQSQSQNGRRGSRPSPQEALACRLLS
jgi:hypothetical protein